MPVTNFLPYTPDSNTRRLPHCGCYVIVGGAHKYLPLVHLDAHVSILSSTSRTTLTQTFVNPNKDDILKKARYIFPLYDGVSVVGFTSTIGSRVIKGIVKERHEAKKDFDEAVSKGQYAGLLEQSEEASDVFTTTLGNIPAGEQVKVEITYLGELKHDAEIDGLRFTIPTNIAPRYGDNTLSTVNIHRPGAGISVTVDADMSEGSIIKSIQSPSHPISINIGTVSTAASAAPSSQRASASLSLGSAELDKDFIVQVVATGLGDPAAILETHPTIPNQRALMTTLVPRFNLPVQRPEVVFVCDRSGSMGSGKKIPNLIAALQVFLKSLPIGVKFNICSFGSRFSFLWDKSQTYDQGTLDKAVDHVKKFDSDYGGTEMYQPMKEAFGRRYKDMNLEVFLLTDGEIWGQDELFDLINEEVDKSKGAIRVFTLGVGQDASHSLIEGVARAGNGFSQTVAEDEKMDKKLVRMLKGALTPHISDYTLEIKYEKEAENGDDDDDDFELVEKVMDALTIDVSDDAVTVLGSGEGEDTEKKTISLFDQGVKDEDLGMPNATTLPPFKLPAVIEPKYLQTPSKIATLFPFNRTTVYILLSDFTPARQPKSVVLKGTCSEGPLELEIPITRLADKGSTIHQLAARKEIRELEEGRGWIYHAKDSHGKLLREEFEGRFSDMVKREGVRLGVQYQIGGKWCSFVAVQDVKDVGKDGEKAKAEGEDEDEDEDAGDFEMLLADPSSGGSVVGKMNRIAMPRVRMMAAAAPAAHVAHISSVSHQRFSSSPLFSESLPTIFSQSDDADNDQRRAFFTSFENPGKVKKSKRAAFHIPGDTRASGSRRSSSGASESVDVAQPVSALASLQTFAGSWAWSSELERILGIAKQQASTVSLPSQHGYDSLDEVLATLCAVVYLKKKSAGEKDTWELFVEKAEQWLADKTGASVESLEKIVEEKLFP